jgi:hypothetical protein
MLRLLCLRWLGLVLFATATAACSSLPELARPRGGTIDATTPPGDWIRYRPLERGDFRRVEPPAVVKQGPYELGAQTCAYVKARAGRGFTDRPATSHAGHSLRRSPRKCRSATECR